MVTANVGTHGRIRRSSRLALALAVFGAAIGGATSRPFVRDVTAADARSTGRIVAVGIPGIGAVSAVGSFHSGGPIRDKGEFAIFAAPGQILDPERILVASGSNFGAPVARPDWPPGSILSIDPRGVDTLVIPAAFGGGGNQASALGGRVRLFTAQSPAFVNGAYNPSASTRTVPAVSNPTGISLNHAFGRPWFTSAPAGVPGPGVVSVIDPDGRPLADAPDKVAGGVFAGTETGRTPHLAAGSLQSGTLANALMGKSPDGSGRAVFAAVGADGNVVQIHVEKGVDGLAPAGTIRGFRAVGPEHPARTGMLFNWVPDAILYVADPQDNALVALTIVDDGAIFRLHQTRRIAVPELNAPIDLAPAVPEIANPRFASNTTLAGGSDIYVANRGNGTIVRMSQDGRVIASRRVEVPGIGVLGPGRLNGIAISPKADRIWIAVSGPQPHFGGVEGAIVEIPAFGAPISSGPAPSNPAGLAAKGAEIFRSELTLDQGLGPRFNARS